MEPFHKDYLLRMWRLILTGETSGSMVEGLELQTFLTDHNLSHEDLGALNYVVVNLLNNKSCAVCGVRYPRSCVKCAPFYGELPFFKPKKERIKP